MTSNHLPTNNNNNNHADGDADAIEDYSNNNKGFDSSMELHSPSPVANIQPRKLCFISPKKMKTNWNGHLDSDEDIMDIGCMQEPPKQSPKRNMSVSPPYRKVRALRLFDTPATPKTILEKSSAQSQAATNHLSGATGYGRYRHPTEELFHKTVERPRSLPLHNRALENVRQEQMANVNPFTPDSLRAQNKKRCRTQGRENTTNRSFSSFLDGITDLNNPSEEDDLSEADCEIQAPKRLALRDTNISRYAKEFIEISLIGIGEFGLVYQCLNRLDGCIYAIKKSIKPVAGSFFEKRALNEVWAHAVLGKHDNVVRYYSAWAEDNHMLIQNEYCNGGSLQSLIQKRPLVESELRVLLLHVAEGLRYIHSNNLVHMDLKPGNIFLTKVPPMHKSDSPPRGGDEADADEPGMAGVYEELRNSECIVTYKIGDLGHVTSIKKPNVEEGDCRYLPNEILQDNFQHLFKADIFSLGLTLYEAAGGGELPKNGPEWHQLRDGNIPNISSLSAQFNDLIREMVHPDPKQRPSSTTIFNHPILSSMESKSKAQLNEELAIEKRKNEILLRKLREAKQLLKSYEGRATIQLESSPQRCLRSYTRKKRDSATKKPSTYIPPKMESLRDRNKNVISNKSLQC